MKTSIAIAFGVMVVVALGILLFGKQTDTERMAHITGLLLGEVLTILAFLL